MAFGLPLLFFRELLSEKFSRGRRLMFGIAHVETIHDFITISLHKT